jgi:hypothetical protein
MKTKLKAAFTALLALFLMTKPAMAHYPFCTCALQDDSITCTGGFSDGTGAEGVKLDVISYDEQVLIPGRFGTDSKASFKQPAGEFYVLFDAGPGHVVEIDWHDIDGMGK